MVTTEQKPHTSEAPHTEQQTSRERRSQKEFREHIAAMTLLAILIATYENKKDDHLFVEKRKVPEKSESDDSRAEIFSLINHAFTRGGHDPASRFANLFTTDLSAPRDFAYRSTMVETPTLAPEFTPAPSMSETPLGPPLPSLAFNDRIRPENTGSRGASDADFAAASRANEMYQRSLFDSGWRGGEATPQEQKAAARGLVREYHPDLPTTSAADAEAVKMFNANHAKPVTHGQQGQTPTPSPE